MAKEKAAGFEAAALRRKNYSYYYLIDKKPLTLQPFGLHRDSSNYFCEVHCHGDDSRGFLDYCQHIN